MTNQEKYQHLINDIFTIWIIHPGLTTIETIDLLRKKRRLDRPQKGLKEFLDDLKKDFHAASSVEDPFLSLPKNDTPPGANPFMSGK